MLTFPLPSLCLHFHLLLLLQLIVLLLRFLYLFLLLLAQAGTPAPVGSSSVRPFDTDVARISASAGALRVSLDHSLGHPAGGRGM